MSIIHVIERNIGIVITHILNKTLCMTLTALECDLGGVRLDSCEPIGKERVKLLIDCDLLITLSSIADLTADIENDRVVIPALRKLSDDSLDRFVQSFFSAFLRQSRGHPLALTLSCFTEGIALFSETYSISCIPLSIFSGTALLSARIPDTFSR